MVKQCKNHCHLLHYQHFGMMYQIKFSKSPGRCKKCNKMCLVCEYWTNNLTDQKCFCCGNKYRIRNHTNNDNDILLVKMIQNIILDHLNILRNNNNNKLIENKYILNIPIKVT